MGKIEKTRIEFEYDGVDYTLEFTAASLKKMEDNGFDFAHIDKRMISAPEDIFCGAFIANHPKTPMAKRLEIYKEFSESAEDGDGTINEVLGKMLSEAIEELTMHKGNIKWKVAK